jgi:hypothetical protein
MNNKNTIQNLIQINIHTFQEQYHSKYSLHPQMFVAFDLHQLWPFILFKKIKVIKKINMIYYIYFFITLIFWIRRMVKVDVQVKGDKHLGMEGVHNRRST